MAPGHRPAMSRLVLFAVALFLAPRSVAPDLAGDLAALLAFRAAVGPHLPWDASAATPCAWRGVTCAASGGVGGGSRVVAVKLPGASLSGAVPAGTVGNLTALQTLSLRFNAISGGLPPDLGNCAELRYLYLRGNRLAGGIPSALFSLALLLRLDLARNGLTGGISSEFSKLPRLRSLYLESNGLNGTIPDLDLPNLQLFNVSYNQLTGPVPASLAGEPASAFLGTGLCGAPLGPCPNSSPPLPAPGTGPATSPATQGSKGSKLSSGAIAGIVAGAVVAFVLVLAVVVFVCCRGRREAEKSAQMAANAEEDASPGSVATSGEVKGEQQSRSPAPAASGGKKLVFVGGAPRGAVYDLEDLLRASAEVLGKGALGTTYRATLESGAVVVAVKRLKDVHLPEKEFRDKVAAIGAVRHDTLPRLQAYFYSKEEKLLVYDFVGAGSLSSHLHGSNGAVRARLDFAGRARIALAAARGIACIHSAGTGLSHGNIKASKILVTEARDGAFVVDHGLAQLVGAAGLPRRGGGYRAPEVTDVRRVSREADVYSFGVVLIELLTGRAPADALPDSGGVDLPRWARSVVQEEWTAEVFDASLRNEERVEEEMMRLLQVGMDCTEPRPERRPAMAEVAARIEGVAEGARRKAESSMDSSQSVSA